MIRAVIDTNILVSGVITRSLPSRMIVRAIMDRKFDIVLSSRSVDELKDVVNRPSSRELHLDREAAEALIRRLSGLDQVNVDDSTDVVHVRDWKDQYVVSTALKGNAGFLVSEDKDLLVLADDLRPFGVEVVGPARFVEVLESVGS